jgi:hypothetical protein
MTKATEFFLYNLKSTLLGRVEDCPVVGLGGFNKMSVGLKREGWESLSLHENAEIVP